LGQARFRRVARSPTSATSRELDFALRLGPGCGHWAPNHLAWPYLQLGNPTNLSDPLSSLLLDGSPTLLVSQSSGSPATNRFNRLVRSAKRDRCRRRHALPGQGSGTACHAAPTEGGGRPRAADISGGPTGCEEQAAGMENRRRRR